VTVFNHFLVLAFLFSGPILASTPNTTFEAGFQTFQFDYKEALVLPAKSSESAMLPGVLIGMEYGDPLEPWFFSVGGTASMGQSVYDGSLQNLTPFMGTTDNRMLAATFRLGSRSDVFWNSELGLFIGVSYENWERNVARNTPHGVRETYSWFSIPVGFRWTFPLGGGLSIAPEASLFAVLGAQVLVHHNEIDSRLGDSELNPGEALGLDFRFPIQWTLTSGGFQVGVVPWLRFSKLGISPSVPIRASNGSVIVDAMGRIAGAYEPASSTVSYGTAFLIRQSF